MHVVLYAGADEKQHFKYAFTSCEVLCCEVDQIYSALLDEEELVAKLFSFLDAPRPLNLTKAGYFARVVLCLLIKRASEMLSFLEAHPAIIERLVEHIDTTSIAEVVSSVRFIIIFHEFGWLAFACRWLPGAFAW